MIDPFGFVWNLYDHRMRRQQKALRSQVAARMDEMRSKSVLNAEFAEVLALPAPNDTPPNEPRTCWVCEPGGCLTPAECWPAKS